MALSATLDFGAFRCIWFQIGDRAIWFMTLDPIPASPTPRQRTRLPTHFHNTLPKITWHQNHQSQYNAVAEVLRHPSYGGRTMRGSLWIVQQQQK